MDKCIICFEQVTKEHSVELKDQASLLNATKIRKFKAVIEIQGESDIPAVKYHWKYCSLLTLKKDLQKLNSENDKTFLPTSLDIHSSNRNSTSSQCRGYKKLPLNCTFC